MDTLFGHLALSFGSHPENRATEALQFVLVRSKETRRLFLQFLAQADNSLGSRQPFAAVNEALRPLGAERPPRLSFRRTRSERAAARTDLIRPISNQWGQFLTDSSISKATITPPQVRQPRPGMHSTSLAGTSNR